MRLAVTSTLLILFVYLGGIEAWWSSRGSRSRGSSSRGSRFSHDLGRRKLTNLYNSRVTKVESYSRPLNGILGKVGIKHTGVVATTKDGGRWLIHKGPGYGKSSSTIVTNAKHMSDRWKKTGSQSTSGRRTISDLMKDGHVNKPYGVGPGRSLCWGSSGNIMKKNGKRRKRAC